MSKIKFNSRLLASLLTASLVTTNVTGCSNDKISYVVTDEGKKEIDGTVDYKYLKDFQVIKVCVFGEERTYVATKKLEATKKGKSIWVGDCYYDVLDGKKICCSNNNYNSNNIIFRKAINIDDYLIYYGEVKEKYSKEDIERIFEKIKQDLDAKTEENDKVLF